MTRCVSTPLHYLDLVEIARRIRDRETTSLAVTETILDRIATLDSQLHSYACVRPESALAQARTMDAMLLEGRLRGPLHGVPIAVKDLFWTKGVPTAAGTRIYRTFVPPEDATVVRRLREAGAVLLGKLQLTEGAFALHHPEIVPPVNPWGAGHWTGASSSGSGVATAAGLCYASLGSDTGGSIRYPAAANGLTGIKPSWGRVSRHGVFEFAASLDHIGPIARSATDATLMLSVIAGHDARDPTSLPDASFQPPDASEFLHDITLGVDPEWNARDTDYATRRVLADATRTLERLGAKVREVQFPDARAIAESWEINAGVEVALAHADTYPRLASHYGPALSRLIRLGRATTSMDYQRVLLHRAAFRGALTKLMSEIDLLLLPVQPFAAPTYDQLGALAQDPAANSKLIQYSAPLNASGHPAITLPGGFTEDGLPIGFQLAAAHGAEALLCRAGQAFQTATDWHRRRPFLDPGRPL
jgi:amidase